MSHGKYHTLFCDSGQQFTTELPYYKLDKHSTITKYGFNLKQDVVHNHNGDNIVVTSEVNRVHSLKFSNYEHGDTSNAHLIRLKFTNYGEHDYTNCRLVKDGTTINTPSLTFEILVSNLRHFDNIKNLCSHGSNNVWSAIRTSPMYHTHVQNKLKQLLHDGNTIPRLFDGMQLKQQIATHSQTWKHYGSQLFSIPNEKQDEANQFVNEVQTCLKSRKNNKYFKPVCNMLTKDMRMVGGSANGNLTNASNTIFNYKKSVFDCMDNFSFKWYDSQMITTMLTTIMNNLNDTYTKQLALLPSLGNILPVDVLTSIHKAIAITECEYVVNLVGGMFETKVLMDAL